MRFVACGLAVALAITASAAEPVRAEPSGTASPAASAGVREITDDRLLAAIDAAPSPSARVALELVTSDVAGVTAAVLAAGGTVTGSVPGALVQASVPARAIEGLVRRAPDTTSVRAPRRVGRPLPAAPDATSFGPIPGEGAGIVGADVWHAAGIRGGVRVGIVDFFDLGLWRVSEHGPVPSAANGHLFCRDTSGMSPSACPIPVDGLDNGNGDEHGVAVAEVVKDIAPDAELYLATVGTTSDLRAAIDWFADNGVSIITRSLGAPIDGPGDGTGPLAAVVDHAAERGITWFNSAGNEADGRYGRYTGGTTPDGYVDFDNGPGVDTTLTISAAPCLGFAGIRWSEDWGKPAAEVTDYVVEVSSPFTPVELFGVGNQAAGEPPLELADAFTCNASSIVVRLRRPPGGDPAPDTIEVLLFAGRLEAGRSSAAHSASGPVTDSANPALIAVGAVDPAAGGTIAPYSSRGPTNDGRTKPDVSAPSCVTSTIYSTGTYGPGACFNGTSAASPAAAAVAALLLGRGLALPGVPLGALVRHLVLDLGVPGPDDDHGAGMVRLPAAPPDAVDARPARFVALAAPQRILDSRSISPTPGAPIGPFAPLTIVDLPIPPLPGASGPVTAVAVSVVSVDSIVANYVQALPTSMGQLGGFANLNVAAPGQIKPNFAIVPVGAGGSISLYLPTGGNVVVDLMGWFSPADDPSAVAEGRFIALQPERVLDTRTGAKPTAGATVPVPTPPSVPADAVALVMNVTATEAAAPGFLRVEPTGASGLTTANGNFVTGVDSGTMSIVPLGAGHTVSIHTSASSHLVADITGYITGPTSPAGSDGLFVPITPGRGYDSRVGGNAVHTGGTTRTVQLGGLLTVPVGASAVSTNIAADGAGAAGFLTAFPTGGTPPVVSNLNYPAGTPISNAGLVRLSVTGGLNVFVNRTTHVIIDVNGYFTGTT